MSMKIINRGLLRDTIPHLLAHFNEGPLAQGRRRMARKSKYGNKKVLTVNGEKFDSRKEYLRWTELQMLETAGQISHLTRIRKECTFDFKINGISVCKYVADAVYKENGERVVEDTKSEFTRKNRAYRIKCKLMRAMFGIEIKEV